MSLARDGDLTLISRIRNVNGKPFSFSFAYHTYFSVSDIRYGDLFKLVINPGCTVDIIFCKVVSLSCRSCLSI